MATRERRAGVDYLQGLAKNSRLEKAIEIEMAAAVIEAGAKAQAARQSREFRYATLKSWSRTPRVIGKAEALPPVTFSGTRVRPGAMVKRAEPWSIPEFGPKAMVKRGFPARWSRNRGFSAPGANPVHDPGYRTPSV